MTKQEVIKILSLIKSTVFLGNRKFLDALDCAIELLAEPEPCEDAVSKALVLETYADLYMVDERLIKFKKELDDVYEKICNLPYVKPKV